MLYLALIIFFIVVFVFLTWRILKVQPRPSETSRRESYICPVCNQTDCECHKGDPGSGLDI